MTRSSLMLTILVIGTLLGNTANADTQFIRYKSYLIPIDTSAQLPAPASLTATKDSTNNVFLVWGVSQGATSYKVDRFVPAAQSWVSIYTGISQNYMAEDMPVGEVYFRVKGCVGSECGRSKIVSTIIVAEVGGGNTYPTHDNGGGTQSIDQDNDGVINGLDFCPDTPVGESANSSGCSPSQIQSTGSSGGSFQCIDPATGQVVTDPNCPDDQIDSDFDTIPDATDPYPYQLGTQCLP